MQFMNDPKRPCDLFSLLFFFIFCNICHCTIADNGKTCKFFFREHQTDRVLNYGVDWFDFLCVFSTQVDTQLIRPILQILKKPFNHRRIVLKKYRRLFLKSGKERREGAQFFKALKWFAGTGFSNRSDLSLKQYSLDL